MAFLQTDLDNLERAIALGVRKAMRNGEMVEYTSLAEMLRLRDMMAADLAGTPRGAFVVTYPTTSRGL